MYRNITGYIYFSRLTFDISPADMLSSLWPVRMFDESVAIAGINGSTGLNEITWIRRDDIFCNLTLDYIP